MLHQGNSPYTWLEQSPSLVSETELALLPPKTTHSTSQRPKHNYGDHKNENSGHIVLEDSYRQARNSTVWNSTASKRWWQPSNPWFYHRLAGEKDGNTHDEVHRRGWRKVVAGAVLLAALVLSSNLALTIYLKLKFSSKDGVGEIFHGDCGVAKRWNTGLHLLINILSTLLLGAGNYTMQCLSAPSRAEVDAAHLKGTSLDIGVLSVRNFFHMRPMKGILWLCLCLSTIPLAFLWNSTIFITGSANSSSYLVVDSGFLSGSPYQRPLPTYPSCGNFTQLDPQSVATFMYDQYQAGIYVNMSAKECFYTYSDGDGSRYRNLILVTTPDKTMRMSQCGYSSQVWTNSSIVAVHNQLIQNSSWPLQSISLGYYPYGWKPDTSSPDTYRVTLAETPSESLQLMVNITKEIEKSGIWHFGSYPIEYCFAEPYNPPCKLQFASFILYTVVACNFIKLVCMSITMFYLWDVKHPSFATVGDAVASFLDEKDETTAKSCLIDHIHLDHHGWQAPPSEYKRQSTESLHNAEPTRRKWTTFAFGYFAWCVGFSAFATISTRQSMAHAKFGAVSQNMLLDTNGDSGFGLLVDILIANSFQVVFSTVYVFYNSTLTARWGAFEWASYINPKLKPLRVTWPQGQQRSTYFLQLPWKYGIPLTILQIGMHFFISQSIFLARLIYYDSFGNPTNSGFSTVGYSNSAALTTFLCWTVVCMSVLAGGFVKVDNRIPMHGNRSVVISALCHAENFQNPLNQDIDKSRLSTRPLMWGVTRQPEISSSFLESNGKPSESTPGHCAFTDEVVELPQIGLRYA